MTKSPKKQAFFVVCRFLKGKFCNQTIDEVKKFILKIFTKKVQLLRIVETNNKYINIIDQ
jgi:hypothetical protein